MSRKNCLKRNSMGHVLAIEVRPTGEDRKEGRLPAAALSVPVGHHQVRFPNRVAEPHRPRRRSRCRGRSGGGRYGCSLHGRGRLQVSSGGNPAWISTLPIMPQKIADVWVGTTFPHQCLAAIRKTLIERADRRRPAMERANASMICPAGCRSVTAVASGGRFTLVRFIFRMNH